MVPFLQKLQNEVMFYPRMFIFITSCPRYPFHMDEFIESTPTSPNSSIPTGGFLDDNNMRCVASTADNAVDGLQKAWLRSLQFDDLSGIQYPG